MTPKVDAYLDLFSRLRSDNVGAFDALVSEDVRFSDPFQDVTGRDAFRRVFVRMFEDIVGPRFTIVRRASDGDVCFVLWQFEGRLRRGGRPLAFDGVSEIHVDAAGSVCRHKDHWDASLPVYGQFPLIGAALRWLRRRIGAGP